MVMPFLTAYDPSDLPGGSIDPLGFERGYLLLAEKILPGLTNVADRPRYFSILCAGASLIGDGSAATPRKVQQARLECVLRLERLWGLACLLASEHADDADRDEDDWILDVGGLRGVTYYRAQADRVRRESRNRVDAKFNVLARQLRYGAIGIYGSISHEIRLWDRRSLTPTADLGMRLAESFWIHTEAPDALRRAVRDDGEIAIERLAAWGERAHVAGRVSPGEAKCLHEALHRDPIRSRMAHALMECPSQGKGETELARLARIAADMERQSANSDLRESIVTILAYEEAYRAALLGFERLLWLARTLPSGAVTDGDLVADEVLGRVREDLPRLVVALIDRLDSGKTPHFRGDLERLADVRGFLEQTSVTCSSSTALAESILARHADVQRGKFDRGRRKMPWIERHLGRIALTSTRVGGLDFEATEPARITPHPYRLLAADRFIEAANAG
jgi:hypothetical protein